jgi:hypothetical protein
VEERQLLEQDREFIREIVTVHDEAEEGFHLVCSETVRDAKVGRLHGN